MKFGFCFPARTASPGFGLRCEIFNDVANVVAFQDRFHQ